MRSPNFTPFTQRIFYGDSNRNGTGPTDRQIEELLAQVHTLMITDSGLQQSAGLSGPEPGIRKYRQAQRRLRRKLAKSIRTGLGI